MCNQNRNHPSDNRLAHTLRQFLHNHNNNPNYDPLKSQKLCGSRVIHHKGGWQPAVYIISNDEEARTFGNAYCNSPWCCPKCTPIVMAKFGERIACAIDALKKQHDQLAAMFTFTIPHTKNMTCKETFDTLKLTWRMFTRDGLRATNKDTYTKKDGTISTYNKAQGAYGKMRHELQSVHNVRVYEFTWGENSWHPHIHALYWFPRKNFYHCVDYEEQLLDRWWHCAKASYLKVLNKKHPDKKAENKKLAEDLYADWRKYPKTGHRSFWISKDADGMPHVQESSYYISGWSGDFEMTNEHSKDARAAGHYSPFQILEEAHKAKLAKNIEAYDKWLKLYTEYALATKKAIRSQFSQSGINQIVQQWKQTETYYEAVKKKFMDKETAKKPWKVIAWLSEQQWLYLSILDKQAEDSIIANILEIAIMKLPAKKRRTLIENLLLCYDIDITSNDYEHNWQIDLVQNQIFENKFADKTA